jgi:hypothetical protein
MSSLQVQKAFASDDALHLREASSPTFHTELLQFLTPVRQPKKLVVPGAPLRPNICCNDYNCIQNNHKLPNLIRPIQFDEQESIVHETSASACLNFSSVPSAIRVERKIFSTNS